ncbi:fumarylacetoacetate hydrolase family protein [Bacillus sp. IBL03825]|uniref:fumarylacetoacetate hydrolase family protein n=1 Tax=Bacillus sp. IBL03825 TaxID=2953580 RepID=UPI002157DF53|nr:fumarylacetoacetate hydrolase family protein [Bacillus sp. IBL03825]MCR6850455.1 fumarylacetoacetate hydrolase family protein [Bacillus sp. IBL03825]
MGLCIVRYNDKGENQWGVLVNDLIYPVEGTYETLTEFLKEGVARAKEAILKTTETSLNNIKILSPVTQPARIVCQGANYSQHRLEAGMEAKRADFNLIFTKADSSLSGAYDDILCPSHVELLDYEIEVGLVIGKEIDGSVQITKENAHEYIAGLVITNDISSRDIQLSEGQWYKGKSYRTFCPTGPYLYLLDPTEISLIHSLELTLSVNGELRQTANTSQLLFKPEETLNELSTIMDLSPGDLVMTGTPGGVALHLSSEEFSELSNPLISGNKKKDLLLGTQKKMSRYLKDGDVIKCEIKSTEGHINLGIQENKVVSVSKISTGY